MAITFALGRARVGAITNPITFSYTVAVGDSMIALLLNVQSGTSRAGGAPTWGSSSFTQANSTQKAAVSPEASAELWYLLNPAPGTQTLTIPNTGALNIFHTVAIGKAPPGTLVSFDQANGANNTAANPSPGAIVTRMDGEIVFAITAGGWQAWLPSAQAGTVITNTDDGATGGGEQYLLQATHGSIDLNWTFGTSDDWGAVVASFWAAPANVLENYKNVKVGDGMSTGELTRFR